MARIFFGCSMRGGRPFVSRRDLSDIMDVIESLGHTLVTHHQTEPGIIETEDTLAKTAIHDREWARMQSADCGIFEISNPSLGVGAEISDMISFHKPVLCLYRQDLYPILSAQILGKAGSAFVTTPYECYGYDHTESIRKKVEAFLAGIKK